MRARIPERLQRSRFQASTRTAADRRARPGSVDRIAGSVVGLGLDQLVRRNLRGVWVRGRLPTGGAVWASNHHGWWDYFAARSALRAAGRRDVGVVMEPANIGSRKAFGWAGAVGTDRLRDAVELLSFGGVLVIFPEARLRPVGPVGPVQPGAEWLAQRAGARLLVVATRVVLRGHQSPEAYLWLSRPVAGDLGQSLTDRVAELDAELADAPPTEPLPGFELAVPGVQSWSERIQR